MSFTPEEIEKLERMFMFIMQRKHKDSDGHCGFDINELEFILEKMTTDGKIKKRRTIHKDQYFLNQNQ